MIARYTRKEMGSVWTEQNKFQQWLEVELAAAESLAEQGGIPADVARLLRANAKFDVSRIHEIEAEVKHDVIAFTTAVSENLGPESRYLHFGLTSNDVVDTAQALRIQQASRIIQQGLHDLGEVLRRRAYEFKDLVMIGRTHGVHAEPITFGLKLANWYSENQRNIRRFGLAAEEMEVGKISGAVGTFAHIGPEIEKNICARLGLRSAAISNQVIQRDRHAWYLSTLAVLAASLEKIALEIRSMQRTEVREAEEFFGKNQKGSSAMPHKRNPVTCEQICGLARVVRSNAQAGLENVALWQERDISHSSVERVIFADSTILADYLLDRTRSVIDQLLVYPEQMRRNLELTRGLIFSGQLLLDLAAKGTLREPAYLWVQRNAMQAWQNNEDFRQLVAEDVDISRILSPAEIDTVFNVERQLRHVDTIFKRVFEN